MIGRFQAAIPFPAAPISANKKRGCEEMNPHFFTAPFYFAFIWFKVQGSGGGFAAFF